MKLMVVLVSFGLMAGLAFGQTTTTTTTVPPTTTTTTAPVSPACLRGFKACQFKRRNTQPDISHLVRDVKVYSGCY